MRPVEQSFPRKLLKNGVLAYNFYEVDDNKTFQKLSETLDQDEKNSLLKKLTSSVSETEDTMQPVFEEIENNIAILYSKLPWYKKLWIFLLSIFQGKSKDEIFNEQLVSDIGRDIEYHHMMMYDWRENLILPGALQEFVSLKEAARFFGSILDSGILANYSSFLVFLGSLEMPELYEELQRAMDPSLAAKAYPEVQDGKLRKIAISDVEEKLNSISENHRLIMYDNARSLFCLKELAFFLFDRLTLAFQIGSYSHGSGQICPFSVIRSNLMALNNILFSFKKMPSISLLNSMYVFVIQHSTIQHDTDGDHEIQRFTSSAEKSLLTIRNFINRVPLTKIIRCGTKDITYEPVEISGGENWFGIFKEKWISTVNENFNEFLTTRKKNELIASLYDFFNFSNLETVKYVQSEENPDGIPLQGGLFLSFMLTFHKHIYMKEMNNVLRPILIDGEFYKRENRIEFTEAYNELLKVDDLISDIQKKLAPNGEWGRKWVQVNQEVHSVTIKHRKISGLKEEMNLYVHNIIETAKKSFTSMENILSGIINQEKSETYDTLANLSKIAGKGGDFMNSLEQALRDIKRAGRLCSDMENMYSVE